MSVGNIREHRRASAMRAPRNFVRQQLLVAQRRSLAICDTHHFPHEDRQVDGGARVWLSLDLVCVEQGFGRAVPQRCVELPR
jgi:hypothetical protein